MGGEVADEMSPAELSPFGIEVVVGPPAIGAGDAGELLAEQRLGLAAVAVGGDPQQRHPRGEGAPERAFAAAQAPAGLIDVERRRAADLLGKRSVGLRQRRAGLPHDGVDRAGRDLGAEQLAQQLRGVASGDAVAHHQDGNRRLQARAEGASRHPDGKLSARAGAAGRAAQAMEPVLGDDDRDRGQLHHLMASRRADGATLCHVEAVAAGAGLGPVVDELIDALERQQGTASALVTGLGTSLPTRGRLARSRRCRGRIG